MIRSGFATNNRGLARLVLAVAAATLLAAGPVPASAQENDAPVIGIHDGDRIALLFAPHKIGYPIVDGWYISGIRIPATSIEVSLATQEGGTGMLRLLSPSLFVTGERSKHFLIRRSQSLLSGDGKAAADALIKALKANDLESPWIAPGDAVRSSVGIRLRELDQQTSSASRKARIEAGRGSQTGEAHLDWDRPQDGAARSRLPSSYLGRIKNGLKERRILYESRAEKLSLSGRIDLVISMAIGEGVLPWLVLVGLLSTWTVWALRGRPRQRWIVAGVVAAAGVGLFPLLDDPVRIPRNVMLILQDGVTMLILTTGALVVLTARRLRDSPPRTAWFLLGILVVGAVLRVFLSEPTLMTAWPYARFHAPAQAVYLGPVLAFITWSTGATVSMVDVLHSTTLVFGILGPWAVFLHAHHLSGDDRAALAAAAILVVLPAHIRFSASDVVFIPSIVFSALALVIAHVALYDPSPRWRVAALLVLPLLMRYLVVMRPLNLVFLLVVGGVIFWLRPGAVPQRRRWLVAVVGLGPGVLAVAAYFTGMMYWNNVDDGLSLYTLWRSFAQLVDPVQNTLVNPGVTPPLFALAALVGFCSLIRTRWRLGIFLLAWLGGFFFLHSYIIPMRVEMTARYHLNLTAPFVILAGAAVPFLLRRDPRWSVPLLVAGIASAVLTLGFVQDVGFTVMEEHDFVRKAAAEIPDGCWVMEPLDRESVPFKSRFKRVTEELSGGFPHRRVSLIFVDPRDPSYLRVLAGEGDDKVEELDRALLLADPPPCLYFYQGFKCWEHREVGEEIAPGCVPPDLGDGETVMSEAHRFRIYDENNQLPFWAHATMFRPTLLRLRDGPVSQPVKQP